MVTHSIQFEFYRNLKCLPRNALLLRLVGSDDALIKRGKLCRGTLGKQ